MSLGIIFLLAAIAALFFGINQYYSHADDDMPGWLQWLHDFVFDDDDID